MGWTLNVIEWDWDWDAQNCDGRWWESSLEDAGTSTFTENAPSVPSYLWLCCACVSHATWLGSWENTKWNTEDRQVKHIHHRTARRQPASRTTVSFLYQKLFGPRQHCRRIETALQSSHLQIQLGLEIKNRPTLTIPVRPKTYICREYVICMEKGHMIVQEVKVSA